MNYHDDRHPSKCDKNEEWQNLVKKLTELHLNGDTSVTTAFQRVSRGQAYSILRAITEEGNINLRHLIMHMSSSWAISMDLIRKAQMKLSTWEAGWGRTSTDSDTTEGITESDSDADTTERMTEDDPDSDIQIP